MQVFLTGEKIIDGEISRFGSKLIFICRRLFCQSWNREMENITDVWTSRFVVFPRKACRNADPIGRAVSGVGLSPNACRDCGLESHIRHGCLSIVSAGCCQVEVSASGWSLVQRSPTECGMSESDSEASTMMKSAH